MSSEAEKWYRHGATGMINEKQLNEEYAAGRITNEAYTQGLKGLKNSPYQNQGALATKVMSLVNSLIPADTESQAKAYAAQYISSQILQSLSPKGTAEEGVRQQYDLDDPLLPERIAKNYNDIVSSFGGDVVTIAEAQMTSEKGISVPDMKAARENIVNSRMLDDDNLKELFQTWRNDVSSAENPNTAYASRYGSISTNYNYINSIEQYLQSAGYIYNGQPIKTIEQLHALYVKAFMKGDKPVERSTADNNAKHNDTKPAKSADSTDGASR